MSQATEDFIKQLEDWGFKLSSSELSTDYIVDSTKISYYPLSNILYIFILEGIFIPGVDPIQNPTLQDVIRLAKDHLNVDLELPTQVNHGSIEVVMDYENSVCKEVAVKPTHKEFGNAGFSYDNETHYYTKKVSDCLSIVTNDSECILKHKSQPIKTVKATKENINEMYKYFKGEDIEWSHKKYTWETCFSGQGWFVGGSSNVQSVGHTGCLLGVNLINLNVVPTESHAKALLALSQLMTIVHKINVDYPGNKESTHLELYEERGVIKYTHVPTDNKFQPLRINTQEGAEILIRDNKELLLEYFNNI